MHLGLIGYGNIASTLLSILSEQGFAALDRVTILVRAGRGVALPDHFTDASVKIEIVEACDAFIKAEPSVVVECAGHEGVRDHVPSILAAGIDVVVVSVGALSDPKIESAIRDAAINGGSKAILPAGAVGGVDIVNAVAESGEISVSYRGTKPPGAWAAAEPVKAPDMSGLTGPKVIFRGNAREAAKAYPKNANVAATLALAGAGFEATNVELVADPKAGGNIHSYEVESPIAKFRVEIENIPSPENPRSSIATIYSVLREIRNREGPVVI